MNWKQAFSLGLCSVGAYERKEPVAYLFNGAQLPKLPDAPEGFEFATIMCMDITTSIGSTKAYYLNFSKEKPSPVLVPAPRVEFFCNPKNGVWVEKGEKTDGQGLTTFMRWQWTNTDILNEDGSVAIAATDPIPVYE